MPAIQENLGTIPYTSGVAMTPNCALGETLILTPTDTVAITLNAPINQKAGQLLKIEILNSSGGVMGAITWNAAFINGGAGTVGTGAFTNPASTKRRVIQFHWNSVSSLWIEDFRTATDQ